ncbi:VPLPA-CTERM sorting domain-containing protein [Gymnodinialimonas sp. 2305UL16-5]|uniref:VPLPA-CTERM sorting domain-containing protein n=1 Tax=Gymnodinialimonas mytili TaxID=3126503 RepID=UPI00309A44D1
MHIKTLAFAALTAVAGFAAPATATTVTPIFADCDPNIANFGSDTGICSTNPARTDAGAINLGAGDGNFYSLGLSTENDGFAELVLRISPAFTGPAMVVEVTNPSEHFEAAAVYVARADANGMFDAVTTQLVGQVNNGRAYTEAAITSVNFSGTWDFLIFRDISRSVYADTRSTDGFDIDSISIAAVPLPAGVLLMLSAIGGLAFLRRRSA